MTGAARSFPDPPAAFRSLPFWAWNGRLDPAEIRAQVRSMGEQGMGGFFMHSRDGLETPYLSREWMEAVEAAVSEAEARGMEAWLYDEDRWPSGSGGGRVPAMGDAFRAKGLTIEILRGPYRPDPADPVVAVFSAALGGDDGLSWVQGERLDPSNPRDLQPIDASDGTPGRAIAILRIECAAGDEWFNGESPPDNLNPDTVDAFLRLNYEPYKAALGARFGASVRGIFTDEPSVHDRHCRFTPGRGWIPWTAGFADFFRARRGYDPLDAIPLVFFDGEDQGKIRHDYWRTVSELFSESYTKRLGAWCESNGLILTGHFLWENQLGTATRTGGAIMPHYRFQQAPGIDILCAQIDETITVKQCSSVANQYGRALVLSETDGCTGWEHGFEDQKWLGDWQFALGVTRRAQHLAHYSLKGCRKRDYPPSFREGTTWWKHARIVEDYFARLGQALSEGSPARDLLVLHPASTAWSRLGSDPRGFADRGSDRNLPEVNTYGDGFNRLLRALLGAHIDFDLGDETILSEIGEAGEAATDGGSPDAPGNDTTGGALRVGRARYRVVLLPGIDTMLATTFALLLKFLRNGGTIIAMEPFPAMIEGRPSAGFGELLGHPNTLRVRDQAGALRAAESARLRPVSLANRHAVEDPDILCMVRRLDGGRITLFAANTDRSRNREILVETSGALRIEELDLLTGETRRVRAAVSGGSTRFMADFGPAGSRFYRMHPEAPDTAAAAAPAPRLSSQGGSEQGCPGRTDDVSSIPGFSPAPNLLVNPPILRGFGPTAEFSRTEPNALVLDRCSYSLGGSAWSAEMEVWRAQSEVRSSLGMRQIHYNGLEQRYLWAGAAHPRDGAPLRLKFGFMVKLPPRGPCWLVLEEAEAFTATLNGEPLPPAGEEWFLDKSFRKIPLPTLAPGWNELILSCGYRNGMEVEDCFILGDFGVDVSRAVSGEPEVLRMGDWCLQGYPHYSGSMVYRFSFEKPAGLDRPAILRAGDFSATNLAVRLNGAAAGDIPWRSADGIRLDLADGINILEIEVAGSPRNLLGPFHLARGSVPFNEWSAFRPGGAEFTEGYVLHPYGLMGQVTLW